MPEAGRASRRAKAQLYLIVYSIPAIFVYFIVVIFVYSYRVVNIYIFAKRESKRESMRESKKSKYLYIL